MTVLTPAYAHALQRRAGDFFSFASSHSVFPKTIVATCVLCAQEHVSLALTLEGGPSSPMEKPTRVMENVSRLERRRPLPTRCVLPCV